MDDIHTCLVPLASSAPKIDVIEFDEHQSLKLQAMTCASFASKLQTTTSMSAVPQVH